MCIVFGCVTDRHADSVVFVCLPEKAAFAASPGVSGFP
jgi:hypothetical protein